MAGRLRFDHALEELEFDERLAGSLAGAGAKSEARGPRVLGSASSHTDSPVGGVPGALGPLTLGRRAAVIVVNGLGSQATMHDDPQQQRSESEGDPASVVRGMAPLRPRRYRAHWSSSKGVHRLRRP